MENLSALNIVGYDKRPISNILVKVRDASDKLVIIFPGIGYTCTMPLLYYTSEVFLNKGYDALLVQYDYNHDRFSSLPEEKKADWLNFDADAAYAAALRHKRYGEVVIVGKSLGTFALVQLSENHKNIKKTVWLTPVHLKDTLYQKIKDLSKGQLVIIGTADSNYDDEHIKDLKNNGSRIVAAEDANHSMEVDGYPEKSLDILKLVLNEVEKFC